MPYLISEKNKKKYFKMSSAENFAKSAKRLKRNNIYPKQKYVMHILNHSCNSSNWSFKRLYIDFGFPN